MSVAAVLLAAGRSRRFGAADKLLAPFQGIALARHAADRLLALELADNYVVMSADTLDWPGFRVVRNATPELGLGRSVALGVAAARAGGASAVLIALADMPFVPTAHHARLIASHRCADSVVASGDEKRRMPPALFGAGWFDTLERLDGDRGAAALIERADLLPLPPEELVDIDRPEDLAAAERRGVAATGSGPARLHVVSATITDPPTRPRR